MKSWRRRAQVFTRNVRYAGCTPEPTWRVTCGRRIRTVVSVLHLWENATLSVMLLLFARCGCAVPVDFRCNVKWVVDVLSSSLSGPDEEGFGILLEDCTHHVASSYIHIGYPPTPCRAPTPICRTTMRPRSSVGEQLISQYSFSSLAALPDEIFGRVHSQK